MKVKSAAVGSSGANLSRRNFLQRASLATAAFTILPRHVFGGAGQTPPSGKLNIAAVGVGGMGHNNLKRCAEGNNIVALCDVDSKLAGKAFKEFPGAKTYKDFRVMFDQQKDIDAVIIATPDHTHAPIALAAMERGKHVYVQKPLAHSVKEVRLMTEAARKYKVVTQMGNQGHSGEGCRLTREWILDGAIGNVHEVHCWTNRPVWPQGIEVGRPTETPAVPENFDWDLWIGPAAMRPYHPAYHPRSWRAWWDFGTGSLGDLGCHIMDAPFWVLDLKYPSSVEGNISTYWGDFWKKTTPKNEQYPRSTIVRYKFPARGALPPVRLTWWDGGLLPPRPEEMAPGQQMGDDDGGVLFIGDKGQLICGCYGKNPRLLPDDAMRAYKKPAKSLARIPEGENGHEQDWLRACKGGAPACSNFDYSGPLSEMVLMGNLAVRFPERKIMWAGEQMAVTNDPEANAFLTPNYREGWKLG